jgi:hypothetical protein
LFPTFSDYPYLWASIFSLVALFLPLFLIMPRELRSSLLKIGILNTAFFPFSMFLEDSYWQPVRFGGWRLGIEDVVISFTLGALVWGLAIWPLRDRIQLCTGISTIPRRLPRPLMYLIPFFVLHFVGLSGMASYLAVLLLASIAELLLRPSMWPFALYGSIIFVPLYFLFVTLTFVVWPDALSQWNPAPPWGQHFFGVPVGELVWAILFGAALPLMAAYILNAKRVSD